MTISGFFIPILNKNWFSSFEIKEEGIAICFNDTQFSNASFPIETIHKTLKRLL